MDSRWYLRGAPLASLVFLAACGNDVAPPPPVPVTEPVAPEAVREPVVGGPAPTLLLGQAWFWKGPDGKQVPGPARLQVWRQLPEGWQMTRLEDGDSNVFHKAVPYDGGILTIGAEKAMLKKWTLQDGQWNDDLLWSREWGGKFNRLRDLEIGDVDGDGKDEFVIATHDAGVVAVYNPDEPGGGVVELDQAADTFVHEIEIGDLEGDGRLEFFATPSGRNRANASQEGGVAMYRWNGTSYDRTWVVHEDATHAKEVLVSDVDGDGRSELFVVMEGERGPDKQVVAPVEIRLYRLQEDGTFAHAALARLETPALKEPQTRFLVPGDFDGDGEVELVAAAMKTGLWLLDRAGGAVDGPWQVTNFDTRSSGFEHVAYPADLDGDGKVELYVAADDQGELKRYTWNAEQKTFDREVLGAIPEGTISWNLSHTDL